MENIKYIGMKKLSKMLKMDRSNAFRFIKDAGFSLVKRRLPETKNQLTYAFSEKEVKEIIEYRKKQGFNNESKIVENEEGYFYIVRLVPDLDNRRIKMGFTSNIENRMNQLRTSAPTLKLFASWPCKKSWESTVIDCLSFNYCDHILNEVFECTNFEKLIKKGDELFKILPKMRKE
jgi:hypothetical protein